MESKHQWCDKYSPKNQEEILISKKTFQEIQFFFENNRGNKFQKTNVLFLFGPSGSGKTSTIDLCCEIFGFSKLYDKDFDDYEKFKSFNNDGEQESKISKNYFLKAALIRSMNKIFNLEKNNVIILKDVPKKHIEDKSINELINNYVKHNTTKKCPIVFILNSSIYAENQMMKTYDKLFKENGKKISFKGFSEKAIEKALLRICKYEEKLKMIQEEILKDKVNDIKFSSNGDMKNAINSLYVFSLGQSNVVRPIMTIKANDSKNKGKGKINAKALKADAKKDLTKLQKDYGFTIFNVLGKFLYNKRKNPLTNEIKQMTKQELLTGEMIFYFNPKDVIRQTAIQPSTLRCFLQENYLDFYDNIEDVVNSSENFSRSDIFERTNFWKERNEDIKLENEYFNTLLIGLNVMINNYNVSKHEGLKQMAGPKLFKFKENLEKYKRKIKEKYSGMTSLQFSNIILNLSEINQILTKKCDFEKRRPSKELINEDCYIIDLNEDPNDFL